MRTRRRTLAAALSATLLLAACTDDDGPTLETAEVTSGPVVETIAAAAQLAPAAAVTVTAPLGGEVVELLVADGDEVEAGQELVRLSSESLEQQIAQAEAALAAADGFGGLGGLGGVDVSGLAGGLGGLAGGVPTVDLSPVFGALAGQFEATVGPLLGVLEDQAAAIEDDDVRAATQQRLAESRAAYEDSLAQLRTAERDARTDAANAEAAQRRAQQQAQEQAAEAERAQAQAEAAQAEAAAAQRRQAELALEAIEQREDDLVIVAPVDGTVEFARGGGGGGLPDLGGLDLGGFDLGALGGGAGDLAGALGGGAAGGEGGDPAATLAEGVSVSPGQPLLTLYDLSSFVAEVEVDEIDVVDVVEGQTVTVLIDAFPDLEVAGRVARVALTPVSGAAGGAIFPLEVSLLDVPSDVRLRVGLSASAEIAVREVEDGTRVPTSALLRRGGQEVVFVDDAGTLREVPVDVVAIGDEFAAVEGDVRAGDVVVTTGVETVADGDTR